MRLQRRDARGATAALGVALLVAACSGGDPDEVEAAEATPEPTIEAPSETETSPEPTEDQTASEEPAPESTIDENAPLYAPLPDLEPDPDNDVPDDVEQLILDAFEAAYTTEMEMYAAARLDEESLRETHFGDGYDSVVGAVEYIVGEAGRELTPDANITSIEVVDFEGGSAVLRECVEFGPLSGLYSATDMQMLKAVSNETLARDRLIELAQWTGEDQPRYRVTQIGFASPEECSG